MRRVVLVALVVLLAPSTAAHAWVDTLMMTGGSGSSPRGGGGPPPPSNTITAINPSTATFTAQAGNAGVALGTFTAGVSGGTFSGTFGLTTGGACTSSADNASFTVASNGAFAIGSSDITTAQDYHICVAATDVTFSNSPYQQTITITGNPPASPNRPSVSVNNSAPAAGSTITITYDPLSSTVSADDHLQLNYVPPQTTCNVPPGSNGSDAYPTTVAIPNATPGPHTTTLRIPMVPSDVPQLYRIEYWQDAPSGVNACQGGSPLYIAATSGTMTVPPTLSAPTYPTAPSYISYPPPGWPSSPNEVVTVCQSGCQYNNLDDAGWYISNSDSNRDWIKVDIQSGTYLSYGRYGAWLGNGAQHVWFYGHGVTRPVITCADNDSVPCAVVIAPPAVHTVVDNLEITHSIKAGANQPAVGGDDCQSTDSSNVDTYLIRNVYVHDGGQGLLSAGVNGGNTACAWTITLQNSHFARFGGPVGPAHNAYFNNYSLNHWNGGPFPAPLMDGHLIIDHSVMELVDTGHSVKSHANRLDINCSQLTSGTAEIFSGSQALDLDGGGGQVNITNSLIVGGVYFYNNQANSPWFYEFGGDKSSWDGDQSSQYIKVSNSNIINDRGQFMLGGNAPMQSAQPYQWSNNVIIGRWDDGSTAAACGGSVPCTTPYSVLPGAGGGARLNDLDFGCPTSGGVAGQDCTSLRDTGTASSTGNLFYSTRATARAHNWPSSGSPIQDVPTRTDQGGTVYTAWPYNPTLFPMPSACTDPVGNVQWPN